MWHRFHRRLVTLLAAAVACALLLTPAVAAANGSDFFRYANADFGALPGWGIYGADGWIDSGGVSHVAFYRLEGAGATGYVYRVDCAGDPNMHPDNPLATGPMAERTFTLEASFDLGYNPDHFCEFYYDPADGSLYVGASAPGVRRYVSSGGTWVYDSTVTPASPVREGYGTQSLAFDPDTGTWYAGAISWNNLPGTTLREIFKFAPGDADWSLAFTYITANPATIDTHHDGMELIDGNLMLADYTGEYICKYSTAGVLLDTYVHQALGHELEGMGFGALGHYWGGAHGNYLTEFGGGRLTDNVGPVTSGSAVALNPLPINTASSLSATVDDTTTGGSDIASAEYSLDGTTWIPMSASDGAFDEYAEDVAAAIGPLSVAGVYSVQVRGTDSAGNVGAPETILLVVYDPSGGFVTGGGWIMSPAGAYVADLTLSGKATFGFVSKYLKGATVPTGNTEFVFHANGMNFKSTSYDWLVLSGPKAQYKGLGVCEGMADCRFMLTAWDGQVAGGGGIDMIRLRVCAPDGTLMYDTQVGDDDSAAPATALGGGSVVVHKK